MKDYLVGSQLDDALVRGDDLVLSYPFADGDIKDFAQAEVLWYVKGVHSPTDLNTTLLFSVQEIHSFWSTPTTAHTK